MQAAIEKIKRIQIKQQELMKRYLSSLKEIEQQQKLISELQKAQLTKDQKIKSLQEQQHILKAAAGSMKDDDKKEFEQVIGKYIREIDKCIDLLSE